VELLLKFQLSVDTFEKRGEYNIFVNIFTKIGSRMYLGLRHTH